MREALVNKRYSVLIQWLDEDQKYIASLPEFGGS
jgi:predicted RNase H-like HicB family nuclease